MLTQNKYDLVLLGNVIVDNVYRVPDWPQEGTSNNFLSHRVSIGGIGNVIAALPNNLNILVEANVGQDQFGEIIKSYLKNIKSNIKHSKKQTSQAVIISNLQSKERTSFVNWGCAEDKLSISDFKTKWAHVCYLDKTILDLDKVRKNSDFVSADLCLSNPSKKTLRYVLNQLKYIDYLFVSTAEKKALIDNIYVKDISDIIKTYGLKCLVIHTERDSFIIGKDVMASTSSHAVVENLDVLGAGDAYCAGFILYYLSNKDENEIEAAKQAHDHATKFLIRQNEKI